MSVNLDLSFEIHDFDEDQRDALYDAAKVFLRAEGLIGGSGRSRMIVDCLGMTGYICGYTTSPMIVSHSLTWLPEVTLRWQQMAERVNGAPCRAFVKASSPDPV